MSSSAKGNGKRKFNGVEIREWVQMLAIFGGAFAAMYQFYFKEILSPAKEPTALDLSVKLEKVREKDGMVYVKAVVEAKNPTHRRIYVPAFWFSVYGSKFQNKSALDSKQFIARVNASGVGDSLVSRYKPDSLTELVAQRRIVFDSVAWWEPSDVTNDEAVFAVPVAKYDYLELRVIYLHTREGEVTDAAKWRVRDDGAWDAQFQLKGANGTEPVLLDYSNADHADWVERSGTGFNWYVTTLVF